MIALGLQILTESQDFTALAPAWHELWTRIPNTTPFQSPSWQLAWWQNFGTRDPVIATVNDGDRLVGLLSTYILDEQDGRKLLPVGIGISDSLDALIAPDAPPETSALLLATCLSQAPARVFLAELPPHSALRSAPVPTEWVAELHPGAPCPVLPLAHSLDKTVPALAMRKLRMNRNRAARVGGTTLRLANAGTLDTMLAELFDLHAACWALREQPGGVLADVRVRNTISNALPHLYASGAVRLAALDVGGTCAAACLAFSAPDRILFYLSGYDQSHAFCSPGSLLMAELLELAIAEGRKEAHFLRGNEAYKYAWGAHDQLNATRSLRRKP
jgi:CelD/BcsL family acetyltransferase involved in cellulose biosynthesis